MTIYTTHPADAPALAVEMRSENDYGPNVERDISDKIVDYFAAGTQTVWGVDLKSPDQIFRAGDTAEVEPAVPGWTLPI